MTPQTATKLTLHDPDGSALPLALRRRPVAVPMGPSLAEAGVPAPGLAPPLAAQVRGIAALLGPAALHRRLLGAADAVAALLALVVVLSVLGEARPGILVLACMPLTVVLFKVAGLYDRDDMRLTHSTLDEAPVLLQLSGLMALVTTILGPVMLGGALGGTQLLALWLGFFAAVFVGRTAARVLAVRLSPIERCLVIGDTARADRIRQKLIAARVRATVVASLPLEDDEALTGLAGLEAIGHVVNELRLDRLIIAPSTADGRGITELIRVGKALGVRVSVQPRMLDIVGSTVEAEDLEGMTLLGVRQFGLSRSSRFIKRAFDLAMTWLGVLAIAPIMALIALAVRLDSRGPILYRQVRVGRDGKHFSIFKFRSMVVGAHAQRENLRELNVAGDGLFKIVDDPRVTRVGRILRRTSLDELPQLLNVLRGEMSLVGPRPLVVDEDAQVHGLDRSRLHLTPGMTGPWQVMGMRVPMQEMVGIDYVYVANWSLWLDLKLLVRTVRHVLRRGNV
jgi:exopolysaccharide biosynthesis polyprenyl glycosylphosphotransferase